MSSGFRTPITRFCLLLIVSVHILASLANTPVFIQLFINSLTCVYIGSCFAVKLGQNIKKEGSSNEKLTSRDAYMFPVYGSAVLFSLYMIVKFLDKDLLGYLFTIYFSFLGQICLTMFVENFLEPKLPQTLGEKYVVNIDNISPIKSKTVPVRFTQLNVIAFIIALPVTVFYALTKNWILNNIFGIAFSISGIETLELPNFKVGFILLWGLFFYDIFWVYGTDVMLTVAKSVDAPIKLLFPYDYSVIPVKTSMLGLGDIVIPGIFVALALKYDIDTQIEKKKNPHAVSTRYFHACFAGYVLGIVTTFAVMVIFQHAQPALLFLVPGCCGGVFLTALVRGEVKKLFAYEDSEGSDADNKDEVTEKTD